MTNKPAPTEIKYSTINDGNMSFVRGGYEETLNNRINFFKKNNLSLQNSVWMKTPHEGDVHIVTIHDNGNGSKDLDSTFPVDALITNQRGIILSLVIADCIPLSLFDQKTKTIALLHVSRHNVNQIIENTIQTMTKNFATDPKNIKAVIGPSIGPCCYTWFQGQDPELEKTYDEFVIIESPTTAKLDLWGLTEKRLIQNGLAQKNISNPKICSFHTGEYYSHRKFDEHKMENDYRFAAIFVLK